MLAELKILDKQLSLVDFGIKQKLDILSCNPSVRYLLEKRYDLSSSFKELTCTVNIMYSQEGSKEKLNEPDINSVMAIIPGYHSCIQIDTDKFKALFVNPIGLIFASIAFSQFEFKSHQFKFKITDLSIAKKPVKVKKRLRKQSFLVNQENKPPLNNPKQKFRQCKGQSKFTCKYNILIENQKNFHIAKKIIGSKGCNMKNIISAALRDCEYTQDHKTNNLVKLRLRGKGSGFKEGPENKESNETLQLCISCKSYDLYQMTCKHVDSLFEKILRSYVNYMKNKKGVCYDKKPVFYDKQEFFYN